MVSIDGTSGIVVLGAVELVLPELTGDLDTILEWADEFRTLGVRANADNPEDAQLSRDFGAEGIGLCRTEHMFLGDRKQIIQTFILNDDELSAKRLWLTCSRRSRVISTACSRLWTGCLLSCACSIRLCMSSSRARASSMLKSPAWRRRGRSARHQPEARPHG